MRETECGFSIPVQCSSWQNRLNIRWVPLIGNIIYCSYIDKRSHARRNLLSLDERAVFPLRQIALCAMFADERIAVARSSWQVTIWIRVLFAFAGSLVLILSPRVSRLTQGLRVSGNRRNLTGGCPVSIPLRSSSSLSLVYLSSFNKVLLF
ncbi:hypothetical protein R1flu_008783 [Riccia fluitans]|uniref:Uncharacterized protein n=1 Tax=Riccia fluitans TaxID=41844 RepID=A0ABD1XDX4_9MARC